MGSLQTTLSTCEIVEQAGMGRVPIEQLLGKGTRSGKVEMHEPGEKTKVLFRLIVRYGTDRHVQPLADDFGNFLYGDPLIGDRMQDRTGRRLLSAKQNKRAASMRCTAVQRPDPSPP